MDAKKRKLSGDQASSSNPVLVDSQTTPNGVPPPKPSVKRRSCAEYLDGYDDKEFNKEVRLKRATVELLISRYTAYEVENRIKSKISPRAQILLFVYYLSREVFYVYSDLAADFCISRQLAVKTMRRVTAWLISISHEYIKWPTAEEIAASGDKFGIPGAIGIVATTTILIQKPKFHAECYSDRDYDTGVILQAVIDARDKFINVYCGEPGTIRNDRVLKRSQLFGHALTNQASLFPNGTFLLGSSAYEAQDWLKTPLRGGNLTNDERKFNWAIDFALCHPGPVFKYFLARFRRLIRLTEETNLRTATNLICAACVVHNICVLNEDDWYYDDQDYHSSEEELEEQDVDEE